MYDFEGKLFVRHYAPTLVDGFVPVYALPGFYEPPPLVGEAHLVGMRPRVYRFSPNARGLEMGYQAVVANGLKGVLKAARDLRAKS